MISKKKFDDIIMSNGLKIDPKQPEMVMMPGISNWAFRYKNCSEIWSAAGILYDDKHDIICFSSWERNAVKGAKSLINKIKEFQKTYKKMRKERRLKMIEEL